MWISSFNSFFFFRSIITYFFCVVAVAFLSFWSCNYIVRWWAWIILFVRPITWYCREYSIFSFVSWKWNDAIILISEYSIIQMINTHVNTFNVSSKCYLLLCHFGDTIIMKKPRRAQLQTSLPLCSSPNFSFFTWMNIRLAFKRAKWWHIMRYWFSD